MDLMTLTAVLFAAVSLLGVDAVINSGSVSVEVRTAPQLSKQANWSVDDATLDQEFENQLDRVALTPSIINPPEIKPDSERSVGMALAEAARVDGVARALQATLGYRPDRLRLAIYVEDGEIQGLITGNGHGTGYMVGNFRAILKPEKGESILSFVRRCALWGSSQLAPYFTALYLLRTHADDGNFVSVDEVTNQTMARLPNTPVSADRALFQNLQGIVALFRNDPTTAAAKFDAAMASDPNDPVPVLNAAFTQLQLGYPALADGLMERLVTEHPPTNKVLLATAYMTWAAAVAEQNDLVQADHLLTLATQINPNSDAAFELWADVKLRQGDQKAADALHRRALEGATTFENYAEVASLYFRIPERGTKTIARSQFTNPALANLR
jgi:Tfp pilus assembly protein PilF